LSPQAAATLRKKETLLLARTHLRQQIQATQHPRRKEMLQNALRDLEKQLANLGALERAAGSY
jgi:galactokinase